MDEPEGRELNHTWRHKDYATNVLSFPADVPDELLDIPLLGDLVICAPWWHAKPPSRASRLKPTGRTWSSTAASTSSATTTSRTRKPRKWKHWNGICWLNWATPTPIAMTNEKGTEQGHMSEDRSSNGHRSWLEKLTQAFAHEPKNRQELLELLREAHQNKLLDSEALSIVEGAIQVADLQVRDIMVPRSQMISIKANQSPKEFLPAIIDAAHSRYPVIGEGLDDVMGILLARTCCH